MACWPGQAGGEGPLLRVSFCLAGTAPICWCLHCLCHPQLLPHSLGITGPGHGTAVLGQQHLQCPLDPHPLCRWGGSRAECSHPRLDRTCITCLFSLCCRRVEVATAHPPGAGSGHCHGHQLQHELRGLLCAVWEAAASPPASPSAIYGLV